MTTEALTLARAMRRFAVTRRRRIAALSAVRAAWAALAVAFTLVYVDVLLQLPDGVRLALDGIAFGSAVAVAGYTYLRHVHATSEARLVARLVEQDDPSLHNDLINAIEFEHLLAGDVPLQVSRPLMQHGVTIASARTANLARVRTLTPPSLRNETVTLAVAFAIGALVVVAFHHVFTAVALRYLDPYGDHPPYSATRLTMDPAGATVDYGEDVAIRARADGELPDEVTLVLEDASGVAIGELPMLRSSEGDYQQTIEHATRDLTYYARIDRGRSKRYALTLGKTPRIGAVNISYVYPKYTKLAARTRQLGADATIRAYEGTQVGITISSNRPLKGGTLRVGDTSAELVTETDPQSATGRFVVEQPANLEARVVDVEDHGSNDVLRAKLEVVPDTKPRIAIVSPGRQAFAIPTAQVPIEIEAQDDLGVASITLFRRLNGSGDLSKTVFNSEGGEVQANAVEVLDLADLGLRPGDVIDFYATAVDTYPKAPHTEATPSHQIAIISEEQYRTFMQQETTASDLKSQYNELDRQIESLQQDQQRIEAQTQAIRNAMAAGAQPSADDAKKLVELSQQQAKLAQHTKEAADALRQKAAAPATFDIENEFKKSLEEMAARLDRARAAMGQSAEELQKAAEGKDAEQSNSIANAQQHQAKALEELGQNQKQFADEVAKPLEEIDRMYKLLEDVETFKAIYAAQVGLERQARSYRDTKAPLLDQHVRLKELGQAQKEIRDATIDLRDNFEEHAAEIQTELPQVARDARDIADGIDGRNIPTVMEQAMSGLAAGDGSDGHQNAEEAAHLLEQMIDRVREAEESSAESEKRLRITMGMDPGATMSQMKSSVRPGFTPSQQSGASSGGKSQSSNAFDMYGPEGSASKADKESAMSKRKVPASAEEARDLSEFAGAFEELDFDESTGPILDAPPAKPVAEEYRPIIEAYFQRIAEEK